MSKIAAFIAAFLFLAPIACGAGDDQRTLGSNASPGADIDPSPGGGDDNGNGETGDGTPNSDGGSPAPGYSFPSEVSGAKAAPLELDIKSECIGRGAVQSLTVKSHPGLKVSWGTSWPDREGHPEWAGAYSTGDQRIPESGTLVIDWAIPPNAPFGEARTDVVVVGKIDGEDAIKFDRAFWKITAGC